MITYGLRATLLQFKPDQSWHCRQSVKKNPLMGYPGQEVYNQHIAFFFKAEHSIHLFDLAQVLRQMHLFPFYSGLRPAL